jgi:cytochrome oxidase Cu insertion factor (SCO1/SenC/PrrC family)
MNLTRCTGGIAIVWAAMATAAWAQAPAEREQGPAVGQPAPDFALVSATREGVGKAPLRLSGFKGKTVVLAFFYKARTKG